MRLLTHNMLQCPRTKTHPLTLHADTCDDVSVPFSLPFIRRMLPRLHWQAFVAAAAQFPDADALSRLPQSPPDAASVDEQTARAIHRLLLEWHVVDGSLEARDGVTYAVKNGVPNLVLTEVRADARGEQPGQQDQQPDERADDMRDDDEDDDDDDDDDDNDDGGGGGGER